MWQCGVRRMHGIENFDNPLNIIREESEATGKTIIRPPRMKLTLWQDRKDG